MSKKRQAEFADLWKMKPGKPTLTPESDPAPAINTQEEWVETAGDESVNPNNAASRPEEGALPDWY
jgi:hypothetical protein